MAENASLKGEVESHDLLGASWDARLAEARARREQALKERAKNAPEPKKTNEAVRPWDFERPPEAAQTSPSTTKPVPADVTVGRDKMSFDRRLEAIRNAQSKAAIPEAVAATAEPASTSVAPSVRTALRAATAAFALVPLFYILPAIPEYVPEVSAISPTVIQPPVATALPDVAVAARTKTAVPAPSTLAEVERPTVFSGLTTTYSTIPAPLDFASFTALGSWPTSTPSTVTPAMWTPEVSGTIAVQENAPVFAAAPSPAGAVDVANLQMFGDLPMPLPPLGLGIATVEQEFVFLPSRQFNVETGVRGFETSLATPLQVGAAPISDATIVARAAPAGSLSAPYSDRVNTVAPTVRPETPTGIEPFATSPEQTRPTSVAPQVWNAPNAGDAAILPNVDGLTRVAPPVVTRRGFDLLSRAEPMLIAPEALQAAIALPVISVADNSGVRIAALSRLEATYIDGVPRVGSLDRAAFAVLSTDVTAPSVTIAAVSPGIPEWTVDAVARSRVIAPAASVGQDTLPSEATDPIFAPAQVLVPSMSDVSGDGVKVASLASVDGPELAALPALATPAISNDIVVDAEAPVLAMDPLTVSILVPPSAEEGYVGALSDALGSLGHDVSKIVPVNLAISQSNVRFFHEADRTGAEALAAKVGAVARDFTSFRPSPSEGVVELWLEGSRGSGTVVASTPRRSTTSTQRAAPARQPVAAAPAPAPQPQIIVVRRPSLLERILGSGNTTRNQTARHESRDDDDDNGSSDRSASVERDVRDTPDTSRADTAREDREDSSQDEDGG